MKTRTIVSFPNPTFFDININNGSLDKAKPSARRGRKAAGPAKCGTSELPKDELLVVRHFYIVAFREEELEGQEEYGTIW
jgi:hypothetical protein